MARSFRKWRAEVGSKEQKEDLREEKKLAAREKEKEITKISNEQNV